MNRARIATVLAIAVLILLGVYVARNSYWTTETIHTPPTGEAVSNPFYAVQKFAEALGARTSWRQVLGSLPPEDTVIVLSAWHWSLIEDRSRALKQWVERGGRLLADRTLVGAERDLKRWAHISRTYPDSPKKWSLDGEVIPAADARCGLVDVQGHQVGAQKNALPGKSSYEVCDFEISSRLVSGSTPTWSLSDYTGLQAVRVSVGKGSVTLVNATPFRNDTIFEGDHAKIFVVATQLRKGDRIYFLSDDESESLLRLIWRYGAPVVVLAAALIALALWRGSARFGPLAAVPEAARRSLGEQIRGTGWFTVRHGGGSALRDAAVRALFEAARRRIVNFDGLPADERMAALAEAAKVDASTLAEAVNFAGPRRPGELRNTLALLESARRMILNSNER